MNKKTHPALAAIRARQGAKTVDATGAVPVKETKTLPLVEATPSQTTQTPPEPINGSEPTSAASPSDDGIPSSEKPTVRTAILSRTRVDDFSEAVIAAQQGTIQEHEFNSSNIKAGQFDSATGILKVAFNNGKVFAYENVTLEQWNTWLQAKSAGGWFHTQIRQRPKVHPFKEVKDG